MRYKADIELRVRVKIDFEREDVVDPDDLRAYAIQDAKFERYLPENTPFTIINEQFDS